MQIIKRVLRNMLHNWMWLVLILWICYPEKNPGNYENFITFMAQPANMLMTGAAIIATPFCILRLYHGVKYQTGCLDN